VEFDNLTALFAAKVPVPQPLYSSGNVLVLSGVITESGKPALPLNSTHLSPAELKSAYTQSLQILNDACTKAQIAVGSFSEADLL
jgi:serine/threonine-protein kinase RIO1